MANTVLIFRIGQLGDTLVTVPALRKIRQQHPAAEIHYLYDQHLGKNFVVSKAVLEGSGLVDRFIPYGVGSTPIDRIKAKVKTLGLLATLRRHAYDRVLLLYPERRTSQQVQRDRMFFRWAGIRNILSVEGYRAPTPAPPFTSAQEHEVDFYLRVLASEEGIPFSPGKGSMDLSLGADDEADLDRLSLSLPFPTDVTPVAVGIGSKMQAKQWPVERYQEVLEGIAQQQNIIPVFFGGPEDAPASDQVIDQMGIGLNLCGKLSIRESARVMQYCRFYLGNDTGTMHLAVAAGLRCVAIFSARDVPGKWYPYGEGHVVHRNTVSCEGCMLMECLKEKKRCLTEISSAEVLDSCMSVLGEDHPFPYACASSD